MIIAIVGMCGSGKSVAADYLRQLGLTGIYFGEFTMERLREKGLPISPESEKIAREEIRREYGMGGFAVLALDKITALLQANTDNDDNADNANKPIFIDGLYSTEEYEILDQHFPGKIILVEVFVDKEVRYRRLAERTFRPLTPSQSRDRDWAEVKNLNKAGPIAMSDYKINNNGEVDSLHKYLDMILNKLTTITHE